jgi:hypothetical protein
VFPAYAAETEEQMIERIMRYAGAEKISENDRYRAWFIDDLDYLYEPVFGQYIDGVSEKTYNWKAYIGKKNDGTLIYTETGGTGWKGVTIAIHNENTSFPNRSEDMGMDGYYRVEVKVSSGGYSNIEVGSMLRIRVQDLENLVVKNPVYDENYDYYLPDYIAHQESINADGTETIAYMGDAGSDGNNYNDNALAQTIISNYGNNYSAYYFEYWTGAYVLLSEQPMSIIDKGYIDSDVPYYVSLTSRTDKILDLREVDKGLIYAYSTYEDNPHGELRLAVPAGEPRLLQQYPAYFKGTVKVGAEFKTEDWGTNQEFALWSRYEELLAEANPVPEPSIPPEEPDPSSSPESPGEEAAGIAEDLVNQEVEVDESALSLLVLVVNFISVPAVAGGVGILIVTMILIALMVKGRGG